MNIFEDFDECLFFENESNGYGMLTDSDVDLSHNEEYLFPDNCDCGHTVSFTGREDMIAYDESINDSLFHRVSDPFGAYSIKHCDFGMTNGSIEKPYLPADFSVNQLQDVCNTICDTLNIRHIPVFVTDSVPNAAYSGGLFNFTMIDDSLYLNPIYANECIEKCGSTDIVISDMAHEIGHALATKYCGDKGTYLDEKMADFISGYVNCKLGVDIDSARLWFIDHYDPVGRGGYPVSEERWDIEAAGYYYAHFASPESLKEALSDKEFLHIIENYNKDTAESLAQEVWHSQLTTNRGDTMMGTLVKSIKDII